MGMALLPILYVGWFTIHTQSYNSLDQNPCAVTAYLMSTCYNGCKLFQIIVSSVHRLMSHRQQRLTYNPSITDIRVQPYHKSSKKARVGATP